LCRLCHPQPQAKVTFGIKDFYPSIIANTKL